MKSQSITIKSFKISDVDLESYMQQYGIEDKKVAIETIRQTAIDAINAQLELIGVKS